MPDEQRDNIHFHLSRVDPDPPGPNYTINMQMQADTGHGMANVAVNLSPEMALELAGNLISLSGLDTFSVLDPNDPYEGADTQYVVRHAYRGGTSDMVLVLQIAVRRPGCAFGALSVAMTRGEVNVMIQQLVSMRDEIWPDELRR